MNDLDRRAEQAIRDGLRDVRGDLDLDTVGLEFSRDDAETVRRAARRLVASGAAELVQGGRVVDPSTAKGPVRVRARRSS